MHWALLALMAVSVVGCRKARPDHAVEITCGGIAVELRSDPGNCGFCGHACQAGHGSTTCVDGACRPVCAPGYLACTAVEGCVRRTATDPRACGACGVLCDHTPCREGVCGPAPTTVAKMLPVGPASVAFAVDGWLYFRGEARRVALASGEVELIAGDFLPIGFEGPDVYGYSGKGPGGPDSCQVLRRGADTSSVVVATLPECPKELAVQSGRAYFTRRVDPKPPLNSSVEIVARDLATGAEMSLASERSALRSLWAQSGRVFWLAESEGGVDLRTVPGSGGAPITRLGNTDARGISADDRHLYVSTTEGIVRLPIAEGDPELLLANARGGGGIMIDAVAVGRDVYWLVQSSTSDAPKPLLRAPL